MPNTHELKTDPIGFAALMDGRKRCEIRRDDRGFRTGDTLRLRETHYTGQEMTFLGYPLEYTGREVVAEITWTTYGPIHGLKDGWVALSINVQES